MCRQFEFRQTRGIAGEAALHRGHDIGAPFRAVKALRQRAQIGETFQASLALALALSEHLSSLAAAGTARLDSIFLDEGFGSLDEAPLDVVAATLENLAGKKDRMVGIVTHVRALAERVPLRFTVARTGATATVRREQV